MASRQGRHGTMSLRGDRGVVGARPFQKNLSTGEVSAGPARLPEPAALSPPDARARHIVQS